MPSHPSPPPDETAIPDTPDPDLHPTMWPRRGNDPHDSDPTFPPDAESFLEAMNLGRAETDFELDTPPKPGPVVPGYELLEVLGRGGMGMVFRARQVALNRIVALKMIGTGRERVAP